jgi:uncharacterized protein involved in exopolysaccharide biosynthesis
LELTEVFRTLWGRKIATVLVIVLACAAAAAIRVASRNTPTGAATVQILVDSPSSLLGNLDENPTPLIARAAVFSQVMASQAVVQQIAAVAGVPANKVTAQGPYSGAGETLNQPTPAEARSNQIAAEKAPYRLTFVAQPNEPVITATVQAPTAVGAATVADSVYAGIERYVAAIQLNNKTPSSERVTLRQLGPAQVATVSSSRTILTAAAFFGVLIVGLLLILGIEAFRRRSSELDLLERDLASEVDLAAHDGGQRSTLARPAERRR